MTSGTFFRWLTVGATCGALCAGAGCSRAEDDADLLPPAGAALKALPPILHTEGATARYGRGWSGMEVSNGTAWRWMGKSGDLTVTSTGEASGAHVSLEGWTLAELLPAAPTVRLLVDGELLDTFTPSQRGRFTKEYDVKKALKPGQVTTLSVEVSRTASVPGDSRDLGFALAAFSWRNRTDVP